MLFRHTIYAGCLVAASATAAQAQENCTTLKQISTIPLEQTADNRWLALIKVNGTDKKMLLDTATVSSALWSDYAAENNMTLTDALPGPQAAAPAAPSGRGRGAATDPAGPAAGPTKVTQLESFTLGTLLSNGGFFKVAEDARKDRAALGNDVVGVLGTDLLSRQDFDMDFGAKQINLYSSDHCPGQVVHWQGPTVSAPFWVDTKGQMRLTVLVDGEEMAAMISTAEANNGMSLVLGKRKLRFSENDAGFEKLATAEGAPAQYNHRFSAIDVGGLAISNPLVTITDDTRTTQIRIANIGSANRTATYDTSIPDVTLGTAFLNKLRIYVEPGERMLYITPAVAPAAQ